jgi:hypothetical protein
MGGGAFVAGRTVQRRRPGSECLLWPSSPNGGTERSSALKERERDDREDEIARLTSKVGEIAMDNDVGRQDRRHGGQKPFGAKEVETMSQTVSPSTSRTGLARRACRVSRAGVYRFLKRTTSPALTRRRGPTGPCPDADLADPIRRDIEASNFHGEGCRKIWARRRVAGVRSSPRRPRVSVLIKRILATSFDWRTRGVGEENRTWWPKMRMIKTD